jgi:hypothetical protein
MLYVDLHAMYITALRNFNKALNITSHLDQLLVVRCAGLPASLLTDFSPHFPLIPEITDS